MQDAEERFFDAARAFQKVDEAARSHEEDVKEDAFKRVIIDIDAAIPGLEDLFLARAKLLKAHAIWWIYWLRLKTNTPKFFDPSMPKDPLLVESHALAIEGRKILKKLKAPKADLKYADDLVAKSE